MMDYDYACVSDRVNGDAERGLLLSIPFDMRIFPTFRWSEVTPPFFILLKNWKFCSGEGTSIIIPYLARR
jgi:hypothetical protein